MKKILVALIISIMVYGSSFAYEPTAKDTKILTNVYKKIDIIYKKKPDSIKKLHSQISKLKGKYKNKEKVYYLLSELENYMSDMLNNNTISDTNVINDTLNTKGRKWKINEVKIFQDDNIYTESGKKLVGLDLSYTNTLGETYNFPGNYSVILKFKDEKGFEHIWEDMDYIATSMKSGNIKNGETKRGWLFIEIDDNIEKGDITFTYTENGIEKTLYKSVTLPKVKEKTEETKEENIQVGLNEKFILDGIEYEIKSSKTINDLGTSNYPKKPKNDNFLVLEYSYKNIDNEHQYPGNFKLKLGEYIYDESSAVTSYGKNIFGYYGGGSSKVIKGTKRDTYTGFDIKNDDLKTSTLIIEAWGDDEKKVFIPFNGLINNSTVSNIEKKEDNTKNIIQENSNEKIIETKASQDNIINTKCINDWPDDYSMRKYCENKQYDGIKKLNLGKPNDIKESEFSTIRNKCTNDWPTDFSMRAYCGDKQYKGVRELNLGKPSDIKESDFNTVRNKCTNDWLDDFSMRVYCEDKQYNGIRELK